MKKNFFLKIEKIECNYEGKLPYLNQSEKGEYEIYNYLISQKKNNNKILNLKTFINNKKRELEFTNFGISQDGNNLAFIYDKKYLVVFDKLINSIKYFTKLPLDILNNIDNYISEDKRNFLKKFFSRISFYDVLYKSNNLFIAESGNKVLITSRKIC